jgi:cytochrome c peroxidase
MVSCASCHKPELAFTDGIPISKGIQGRFSRHNSSTLLNIGFSPTFMFDMRATNLDIQSLIPIHDTNEMDMTMPDLNMRLKSDPDLKKLSMAAYNREIDDYVITHSLASFMKSLISSNSKYDRSLALTSDTLLTDNERHGKIIFFGKGACNSCHTSPLFTNHTHYNLGLEPMGSNRIGKLGATHKEEDRFRFKTPTLRNIEITFPYFHNGKIETLEKAISFHLSKERKTSDYSPPKLNPVEQRDLVLFLHTLTDNNYINKR